MSFAFEITADDVYNVLMRAGKKSIIIPFDDLEVLADQCFDNLDTGLVESAALSADVEDDDESTLDNQTDAAYDAIRAQLVCAGVLQNE